MSALAGIVRFDGGPADPITVGRMIDCVEHRGLHWRNIHTEGSVAFAYRWGRTGPAQQVDEQPVIDRQTQAVLVFDGRLDNRPELANELDLRDDAGVSDAAMVLAAHRRWGRDMVPRLLGDFAFALWDGRERRLILARDPRGIRSVAYAVGRGTIAFATEPRQLLRAKGVDASPNMGFIGERLSGFASHPSETIFRGIQRVPAAHMLTASPVAPAGTLTCHWEIDPRRELRYADDAQYAEHLQELYSRAVSARLRGLSKVAVLLSGGVDSSSIAGLASRLNPGGSPVEVRTYHHSLRGYPDADEEQHAESAARHCGIPFVSVPFEGADLDHHLDNARRLEDTTPGTFGLSDDKLASRISDDGATVVLSGIGGDEWFGGAYQHSADLLRGGHFVAAARQVWADGHNPDAFHGVKVLAQSCVWAATPAPARRVIKGLLPRRDLVPRGFNRRFAADVSLVERITPAPPDRRFPTLAAAAICAAALHPDGVNTWDEGARHVSLWGHELSAPLLDRRLAEFAMAIPEEQRWSGDETKRVLRAAIAGILPEDVRLRRRKSDPGAVTFGELTRMHEQGAFTRMELVEAGVLDQAAIASQFGEMRQLFADGKDRYKVLAYSLWAFFAGECVWRTLFGRRGLKIANLRREGVSGAETQRAGAG
jgi:asparagine synthase (glutamine-hydrolysing)